MKKSIIYILAAAAVLASCQSLDLTSSYQVASSNVWGTATLARQAVNGIYNEFYVRSSTNVNEDNWKVYFWIILILMWVVNAALYWGSYKIFSRMQVINNKWLNIY